MDDVRLLAAAERRHRWAAQQVRRFELHRRLRHAGAAFSTSMSTAAAAFRSFANVYADTDLAAEVDDMWDQALVPTPTEEGSHP